MLPRIKISYLNGLLGTVSDTADGLFAIVVGASEVEGKFTYNTPETITSLDDLADYGITAENNAALYKAVEDFYNEAEEGTKVVIMGVLNTTTKKALCDKTTGALRNLIVSQNGTLRGIFVGNNGTEEEVLADAIANAQALAEWSTDSLYAPLFIVFDKDVTDLSEPTTLNTTGSATNRVAVLVGDTTSGSASSYIGGLAGRLASVGVQRNCGRVKDGSLYPTNMYIGTVAVESADTTISTLYDKGYLVVRKYVGRSGYFFADDNMACDVKDDYSHIALRRTIDKAYRITYDTLLDMMLDELEINSDGTLQVGVIKSWQQAVENAINRQMAASGELSSTNGEEACECYIDETQNVLSTSKVEVTVKVRPYGYARFIDVNLGFAVTNA